jgi:quinol monooxygenase YgiN
MSVVRMGEMQAQAGQGGALLDLLRLHFVPAIEAAAGCRGYQVLQRSDDPARIAIIEVWDSLEAHQASAMSIPPHVIEQVKELLAAPPAGGYYDIVAQQTL